MNYHGSESREHDHDSDFGVGSVGSRSSLRLLCYVDSTYGCLSGHCLFDFDHDENVENKDQKNTNPVSQHAVDGVKDAMTVFFGVLVIVNPEISHVFRVCEATYLDQEEFVNVENGAEAINDPNYDPVVDFLVKLEISGYGHIAIQSSHDFKNHRGELSDEAYVVAIDPLEVSVIMNEEGKTILAVG